MSMHTPQGPQRGGASVEDIAAIFSALWRFVTGTRVGAILAIALIAYVLFNLLLFAGPRVTLMMAQNKGAEEQNDQKSDGKRACYAIVIASKDTCVDDAGLPAPDGDVAGSEADATPVSILLPSSDGDFETIYGLTVKIWQAAVAEAPEPREASRRKCIAQIITDRFGERNTFATFSGEATERNASARDIGIFSWPVVRLGAPDYGVPFAGLNFAPLKPENVKQSCGD